MRHLSLLIVAVLPIACAAPDSGSTGVVRVIERREVIGTLPRGEPLLDRAMIDRHNEARRAVEVPPLMWDQGLARHALDYALVLARTGRFRHAEQRQGPGREGENLFMGTAGAYSYDDMVRLWVAERRYFTNGAFPAISTSGRWQDVGHYTQVVWRTTTRVGCGLATGGGQDYLVCRYSPPGNVIGLKAF